jgi:hypothetical protein
MPLTPSLGSVAFATDALTGTVTDNTVYGDSNPDRSDVVTYISVYKLDKLGNTTAETVSSYDEQTAENYEFTISQDGWMQAWFVIIPNYDDAATYNRYDVVYEGGVVYRSKSAAPITAQTPPNTVLWEVISDPTGLIDNDGTSTESANLIFQIFDFVASPNTRIYAGNGVATASEECCTTCKRSEDVLDYELFYVLLDGMVSAGDRGRFAEAERHARKAQEEYANLQ